MTDQKLIKMLRYCHDKESCENCRYLGVCEKQYEGAKWISVDERLPEDENECVLALVSGVYRNLVRHSQIDFHRCCEIATYGEREGWILETWPEWENPGVTHWMPLPSTEEVEQ